MLGTGVLRRGLTPPTVRRPPHGTGTPKPLGEGWSMSEDREYVKYAICAVAAAVLKDGKILLVKRRYNPGAGRWALPGGVVEAGEYLEEAVKREVLEETGIDIDVVKPLEIYNYIHRDRSGRVRYHYVIIVYLARPRTLREPKPSTDAEDAKWIPLESALKLRLTDSTRHLIKKLLYKKEAVL